MNRLEKETKANILTKEKLGGLITICTILYIVISGLVIGSLYIQNQELKETIQIINKMNRPEHIKWCKERANEYIDRGELPTALASFYSDMGKHPETSNHIALELGSMLLVSGQLKTPHQIKDWINGFN